VATVERGGWIDGSKEKSRGMRELVTASEGRHRWAWNDAGFDDMDAVMGAFKSELGSC
jgi:hypothetical protein